MAKCKQCDGRGGYCTRCGGSGKVPGQTEFVEAVRAAAANPVLDANQCLAWLKDKVRS